MKDPSSVNPFWLVLKVSVIIVAACIFSLNQFASAVPDNQARVIRLQGVVLIERGTEKLTPAVGNLLNQQDVIYTQAGSFIEIAFDGGFKNILRIDENSRVVMENVTIGSSTNVFMDKGKVLLNLNKMKKGSTFKVRTPVAVAGARGTGLAVELISNEAIIQSFQGQVFVKGLTQEEKEMMEEALLKEGWKVFVEKFEAPSRMEQLSEQEIEKWNEWKKEIESLIKESGEGRAPGTDILDKGSYLDGGFGEILDKKEDQFESDRDQDKIDKLRQGEEGGDVGGLGTGF